MTGLEIEKGENSRQDRIPVKRETDSTDRAIDRLVYEVYGISEKEVKIVEEGQYLYGKQRNKCKFPNQSFFQRC